MKNVLRNRKIKNKEAEEREKYTNEEIRRLTEKQSIREKCEAMVKENYNNFWNKYCKKYSNIEMFYHCSYPEEIISLSYFGKIFLKNKDEIINYIEEYKKLLLETCATL